MKLLLTFVLLSNIANAQLFTDIQAGLSTRMMVTGHITTGYLHLNRDYIGPMVAATAGYEQSVKGHIGAIAGIQTYAVAFYGGYGKVLQPQPKEGLKEAYFIYGIQYRYSDSRGLIDLRYQAGAFHLTLGCRLGKYLNY